MTTFGKMSNRVLDTNPSCIKQVMHLMRPGIFNMGHGMVYWTPPNEALEIAQTHINETRIQRYGPIEGNRELLELVRSKISKKNNLQNRDVMMTAGANQAFINVVMTLCDPGDEVIILSPYYFNHMMALQLLNCVPVIVECDEDLLPRIEDIKLALTQRTKMLVIVSPGNPSGLILPKELVQAIQQVCMEAGVWLISDEAYEDFVFDLERPHYSPDGVNVINIFSLSKSYGLHGWRVGYVTFPPHLRDGFDKVQDTIPINVAQMSQEVALQCLKVPQEDWVKHKIHSIVANRELVWEAVSQMDGTRKTMGAFYFMVQLPNGMDAMDAVTFLAQQYNVMVIPCNSSGKPNHIRVSYGNLPFEECQKAAAQLKAGLKAIKEGIHNSKTSTT